MSSQISTCSTKSGRSDAANSRSGPNGAVDVADADDAALVVSGGDLAALVELAVGGQVRLGRHTEHRAAVDDHRGVVDALPVAQRGTDDQDRQQIGRGRDDLENGVFDVVEQEVLQHDVLDRVPGQRQLREDRHARRRRRGTRGPAAAPTRRWPPDLRSWCGACTRRRGQNPGCSCCRSPSSFHCRPTSVNKHSPGVTSAHERMARDPRDRHDEQCINIPTPNTDTFNDDKIICRLAMRRGGGSAASSACSGGNDNCGDFTPCPRVSDDSESIGARPYLVDADPPAQEIARRLSAAAPSVEDLHRHEQFMRLAIDASTGNPSYPFGAVIVDHQTGEVLGRGVTEAPKTRRSTARWWRSTTSWPATGTWGGTAQPCIRRASPARCVVVRWLAPGFRGWCRASSIPAIRGSGIPQFDISAVEVAARTYEFYQPELFLGGVLAAEMDKRFATRAR